MFTLNAKFTLESLKLTSISSKIDKLFLIYPSFYTILSGGIIAAAINLITGLVFTKDILSTGIIFGIFVLLFSSMLFIYISLNLESLRFKAEDPEDLLRMISHRRMRLWPSLIVGFECIIVGIFMIFAKIGG